MAAHTPVIIWLIGMAICAWIAHVRGARANSFWRVFVVSFGPLAIPFMIFIKPSADDKP